MNLSAFLIAFHTMKECKAKVPYPGYIPITSDTTCLRATHTISPYHLPRLTFPFGAGRHVACKISKHQKLLHYLFTCVGFAVHITPAAQTRTQPDNVFCKDCWLCVFALFLLHTPQQLRVSLLMCRTLFVIHV